LTLLSDAAYVAAQYQDASRLHVAERRRLRSRDRGRRARGALRRSPRGAAHERPRDPRGGSARRVRALDAERGIAAERCKPRARFAAHVEREIARSGSLHVGIAAGLVTGVRR
jgi:hypothetical protein